MDPSGEQMTVTFGFSQDEDGELIIVDKDDEGGDTPYMEIGICSAL